MLNKVFFAGVGDRRQETGDRRQETGDRRYGNEQGGRSKNCKNDFYAQL
ncbi:MULTISPECIES: hypothetical protein [unclassified Okeania]|nr:MULTISPECIES: hypothetical protein [unclassified Okeania]NES79876.1 hypothetical protein [Okeania sp. SIO1H4]NET23680.1 hypothetical protein [Okeania sp. SIO1H5]NET97389.1 hypothetical protein [Okeania sp. SIO1H2]